MSKPSCEKGLSQPLFHRNFKRTWCWRQKRRSTKNVQKLTVFLLVFGTWAYVNKKQKRLGKRFKTTSKFIPKIFDFWLKFWSFSASMFEREILRSWGGSWLRFRFPFGHLLGASGRLGPHLGRLGPHFGAKVPTRRQPHHPTKKTRKPGVPKSCKIKGWRHEHVPSGARVKQPIPKKAYLKYGKTLVKR